MSARDAVHATRIKRKLEPHDWGFRFMVSHLAKQRGSTPWHYGHIRKFTLTEKLRQFVYLPLKKQRFDR